jgi:integrase/recombinase XerD
VDVGEGLAYWTVLTGPTLTVVEPVDAYLRHLRFGRGRAESTTETYAGHLRRFHEWRARHGLSWEEAARRLATYVMYLRTTPRTTPGRGRGELPSDAALAPALAAIHGFYLFAADAGLVGDDTVTTLFTVLPAAVHPQRGVALRPRIRAAAGPAHSSGAPPAASRGEFTALLQAATTARDVCMIALLGGCALRVGQLVSLMREDVHLVPAGSRLNGCEYVLGPHLHLRRRDGHPKGAANKNRGTVIVPVPQPIEMLYAAWLHERKHIRAAIDSPWAFVTFPGPTGAPGGEALSTRRVQDLVSDLAGTAGLRHLHPHMLRHTFGATAADLDVARDVLQRLLGQASVHSQTVYRHATDARMLEGATAVADRLFGRA